MTATPLTVLPVAGIGEIVPGAVIADAIVAAAEVCPGDVVVVAQKIVSKAEGRLVPYDGGAESRSAIIVGEASRVLRRRGDLVIAETRHGFICASAGVDFSNVDAGTAALLPNDPDRSARRIRDGIVRSTGHDVAVVISDTFGRPWRRGLVDVALGVAGVAAIVDLRGEPDGGGRTLRSSEICVADEIAAAVELVMGKSTRGPVALVRGIDRSWFRDASVHDEVVRRAEDDLFR